MNALKMGTWVVRERRRISRYVIAPPMAPLATLEHRIGILATCPNGHELPFEVTADKAVVVAVRDDGVTIACGHCSENFLIDLGAWPPQWPE